MIDIEDLHFRYPGMHEDTLGGLNLQIAAGSLFGLLGPNGSGKTTLVSLLTGLLLPTSGSIRINDRPLPRRPDKTQRFRASVPQDYAFYLRLSVLGNLRFFARANGLVSPTARERIDDVMQICQLESHAAARAGTLSGGLKRRLNLAIGLLNQPQLLFLDEPTVGIDPQSRRFILDAIRRINAEGTTIVYTTHYMEEVEQLCRDIAVLDEGKLLAVGTLENLLRRREGERNLDLSINSPVSAAQREALQTIPGIELAGQLIRLPGADSDALKHVMRLVDEQGIDVTRLKYGHGNLEDLFLHLTGRSLRD